MIIKRDKYLNQLIRKKNNGKVKVITGIRRCGKSYLLTKLYKEYLNSIGIDDNHIIIMSLEDSKNIEYRNPLSLNEFINNNLKDNNVYYIMLDEIQKVKTIDNPYLEKGLDKITFVDVLLEQMKKENVDLYVTGSNSLMLSKDIITDFRGRGDEIHIYPLTFKEINSVFNDAKKSWNYLSTYGGMPEVLTMDNDYDRELYLKNLFKEVYLKDIIERHQLHNEDFILSDLLSFLSSSIGSLTNSIKLSNTFKTEINVSIKPSTINNYLDYFVDSYLIEKVQRYNIKGRKYIGALNKYFYTDIGLRNAMINFRQYEPTHIMENIIFNELVSRGYDIDVGIIEYKFNDNNIQKNKTLEVDFIVNKINEKCYIQSVFSIPDEEKRKQETFVYSKINDSFKKIVIVKDEMIPYYDDNGIYYIGLYNFLLNEIKF